MFGFNKAENVANKATGKFGLNKGYLTKFEFNSNGGKDNTPQNCVDISFKIEDKDFYLRIFEPNKVWKDGIEITDKNSDEYKKSIEKQNNLISASLCDIAVAISSEEIVNSKLENFTGGFKEFVDLLSLIIKSETNWDKKDIDIFLQYQYSIKGENNCTFLEIPANPKQGQYVSKHIEGNFKADTTKGDLKYINEEGIVHPFKRTEWFMNSNYAKRLSLDNNTSSNDLETNSTSW